MGREEIKLFGNRTTYTLQLVKEKKNEEAKLQILGFMMDFLDLFGVSFKNKILTATTNPQFLVQNKGVLGILSSNCPDPKLKQMTDGLIDVVSKLWKTTDPAQDLSGFKSYLEKNGNEISRFALVYEDLKKMTKNNYGDSDIKKIRDLAEKYNKEVLPKMKEFMKVVPDPGTFLAYCKNTRNQWMWTMRMDRISLIPFYIMSVYPKIKEREFPKLDQEVDKIGSNLTESSLVRLEMIEANLGYFFEIDDKDDGFKKLETKIGGIKVKAKKVYEEILSKRRMSAEGYSGSDKANLAKEFEKAYKKAYPKEKFQRIVITGKDWVDQEYEVIEYRESAGKLIGVKEKVKYKSLEAEVAIKRTKEPKVASIFQCYFAQNKDASGKPYGNYYLRDSGIKFTMFVSNVNK